MIVVSVKVVVDVRSEQRPNRVHCQIRYTAKSGTLSSLKNPYFISTDALPTNASRATHEYDTFPAFSESTIARNLLVGSRFLLLSR